MYAQFEAFAKGFMMLCGGPAIHLFSATELERLVCGNPILDFNALQANARYEGGFSPDHRVRGCLMHASADGLHRSVQVVVHSCVRRQYEQRRASPADTAAQRL